MITYDEFKKVEIRAGKIVAAEKVPETDKLLKLSVDFGEVEEIKVTLPENPDPKVVENPAAPVITKTPRYRQIISGIALKFPDITSLVGKTCMFVTNLEPRIIKGLESNGMLFAVSTNEGGFSLLEPNGTIPPGTLAI
ncbi:MAG: hypothetical protein WCT02_01110 [Candidatus Paceibacterota bacterium]